MSRSPSLSRVGALLTAMALTNACSCGNPCSHVTCGGASVCVPADGLCHCGGVDGDAGVTDVVCGPNEACSATLRTCVSTLCDAPDGGPCSNGTACDPADGVCKCGGQTCAPDQLCNGLTHVCETRPACQGTSCALGLSCDPTDGVCKCGGVVCAADELCQDGGCAADPCFGVSCVGDQNQCYGGVCRCGSATGPSCDQEQFCDGTTCRENSVCEAVACEPGEVCGSQDGLCHCGATTGPVCRGQSTCVLYLPDGGLPLPPDASVPLGGLYGRCLGGDLCAGLLCDPGEVCDSSTGSCLCGAFDAGSAPIQCRQDQVCDPSPTDGVSACLSLCNPYGARCPPLLPSKGGLDASVPQACYYAAQLGSALCQPEGGGHEGDACQDANQCLIGSTCATPPPGQLDAGAVASCRQYCNSFDGGSLGCDLQDRQCYPLALITNDAGSIAIGTCWPPLVDGGQSGLGG